MRRRDWPRDWRAKLAAKRVHRRCLRIKRALRRGVWA